VYGSVLTRVSATLAYAVAGVSSSRAATAAAAATTTRAVLSSL
jgi:hypothetical protein